MSRRYKILLVEDDPINSILMQKLLAFDFEVEMERTPEKALEAAGSHSFELFLLDINLGKANMDGLELMQQLRKLNPKGRFIALTSYAMPGDRENFLEAGFDGYVSKPVMRDQIKTEIETLMSSGSESSVSSVTS